MSRDPQDETRLSRWSRLKRTAPAAAADPAPEKAAPPEEPAPETEEDEVALLDRLGLPSPETLAPGDDFSAFMAAHVPGFLRQRALRVLWRSNPDLAVLDGLLDYGEDFRAGASLGGVVETAYKVGRGFRKSAEEEAEAAQAAANEAPETTPEASADEAADRSPDNPAEQMSSDDPAAVPEAAPESRPPESGPIAAQADESPRALLPDETADPALPPPRRMIFVEDR